MMQLRRILFIGLMFCLSTGIALGSFAQGDSVAETYTDFPLVYEADVVVLGANAGGVAAALTAARRGATVVVLFGQYYPTSEMGLKNRYWLEPGENTESALSKEMLGANPNPEDYFCLTPDTYKKNIEQLLMNAGIEFVYNCHAVEAVVDKSGELSGVMMANKSGIQAVSAKVVIDATQMAGFARIAGVEMTEWKDDTLAVSASFTSQKPVKESIYKPKPLDGGTPRGDYREYSTTVHLPAGSWLVRCKAERQLRLKLPYRDAAWAPSTMHLVEPVSIVAKANDPDKTLKAPGDLDLDCCRPASVKNIYVLNACISVSRTAAERLIRPLYLIDLGERVGKAAYADAQARPTLAASNLKMKTKQGKNVKDNYVWESRNGIRPYRAYPQIQKATQVNCLPIWKTYDVIVVGGGTAGAPAAIGAARAGADTLCIEMTGWLGGVGTHGVSRLWDGYTHGFAAEHTPKSDYIHWGPPFTWQDKANWLFQEIAKAGGDVWLNTTACGVIKQGQTVTGVVVATPMGRGVVMGKVVIDASGDADASAWAGCEFEYADHDICLMPSVLCGGKIDDCHYANGGGYPQFNDVYGTTYYHVKSRALCKHRSGKPFDLAPLIAARESRRIVGRHTLSYLDIITQRTFRNLLVIGLSGLDSKGAINSKEYYANLRQAPGEGMNGNRDYFYLPLDVFLPRGLENIVTVGKCFSADHDALCVARMQPDVSNQGYAAGYAAALAVMNGTVISEVDIRAVQTHLRDNGNISHDHFDNHCVDSPEPTDAELQAAARKLSAKSEEEIQTLMKVPQRSIPFLLQSFKESPSYERAKLLCLLGDSAPSVVDYMIKWLDGENGFGPKPKQPQEVPRPDDVDKGIWSLGTTGSIRAIPVLVSKLKLCRSNPSSDYSHIRALAHAFITISEKNPNHPDLSSAADALKACLKKDGMSGHVLTIKDTTDFLEDYMESVQEILLAAALHKCGDPDGRAILEDYLQNDWRGVFSEFAGSNLYGRKPVVTKPPLTQP